MPDKILKRTSFGLIRTNPRLTTNIKIVADSQDKIYLESIDADPLLSKSIYKGYKVSFNGSYSYDLKRFYSQNGSLLPQDIAYTVFEEDSSTEIKNRYHDQYDFTYGAGFYPKNSRIYPEEFAIFSPLWLERDNIPEHFVIFRMDGPVTINTNDPSIVNPTTNLDTDPLLSQLIEDPSRFFENYIQKAKIIKTFDLTEKSPLGIYLRNHVNDPNFPESSLYASIGKNSVTYWRGISYKSGGFASSGREIYSDYTLVDKTITELDDKITTGFRDASIVCPNLMNMEFLFDDPDQEKYKFSRYFGLYMSEVELGKFILDPNRLFEDKDAEYSQSPMPKNKLYGDPTNTKSVIQYNPRGIKIYPKIGPTGPYSGRLLTFQELQNPRFGYVKDTNSKIYSIDNVTDWATTTMEIGPSGTYPVTDTNYIRIKNTYVDWKNFTGFDEPFDYIPAIKTDKLGIPSIAFKVVDLPSNGDQIRIRYTDWTDPREAESIDEYTIVADNNVPAGKSNGLVFSNNGTLKQITQSINEAIGNIHKYAGEYVIFSSIVINDEIILYSRVESENWNKLKISLFSSASTFPFDISNQYETPTFTTTYQPSPVAIAPLASGNFVFSKFYGGNNNPKSRAIVEKDKILEFGIGDTYNPVYVKTDKGYQTIEGYGIYLDEPIKDDNGEILGFKNTDKYFVVNLSDFSHNFEFGSSDKIALYNLSKNSCGYLSILPIRDFDFDFEGTEYNRSGDSNVSKLWEWYKGTPGPNGYLPIFDYSLLSTQGKSLIDNIVGATSPFMVNGEFQRLIGYTDEFTDEIDEVTNEYSRLRETTLAEIALSSRVVPFINKWVYDNECVDVRENGYRLNSNGTFGYSNFSPSFDEISRNTKFFTHEWYYLQKYPPYMTFEEKLNSFSYFDEDINFPTIPDPSSIGATSIYASLVGATGASANLLSIEEDYFLSYFTRESIDGLPIERDFRYSIFSLGDSNKAAESLFRGAKVEIKDRAEFNRINFDKESLRYVYNEKYNGYKFSSVLTYGNAGTQITFVKNDKFKAVTMVIQSDLKDILTEWVGPTGATGNFIDRGLLYCINDRLGPSGTDIGLTSVSLSGLIGDWTDNGTEFIVTMVQDSFGNFPNLIQELTQNENGSYNDISITNGGSPTYTFKNIFDIQPNQFKCTQITGLDAPNAPSITPNGSNNRSNLFAAYLPPTLPFYFAPFNNNPLYVDGGFNAYNQIIDSISFSSISSSVNSGEPEIRFISVSSKGEIQFNTYAIDIVRPDYPVASTYLKREILRKTSSDLQVDSPILGYKLGALDRVSLNQVSRYRGPYNPKWRDIVRFIDMDDLKSENLSYYNIQILSDLGYYKDYQLGQIPVAYFNKVNVENPNIILSNNQRSGDSVRFIYPLIGEMAIDFDNFFIFKSNWDPDYFKKYTRRNTRLSVIGTREPKEEKSFFGSKAISIPNGIRLETFPSGTITQEEFLTVGSIKNTPANLVTTVNQKQAINELTIDVYVTESLKDWLLDDGIATEFKKYINPNYSFGDIGLDDDVKLYIEENIFVRYSVKEIILWEKIWNPKRGESAPPQVVTGLTDTQKLNAGYKKSKSFRTIFDKTGGLNFKLIYTIPKDKRTSIAFSVILEKK